MQPGKSANAFSNNWWGLAQELVSTPTCVYRAIENCHPSLNRFWNAVEMMVQR